MNRYETMFAQPGGKIIPYFTLGDPDESASLALIRGALEGEADGLELGIPFSDPVADGPILQRSVQRALAGGMTPDRALKMIRTLRAETEVPLGIMTYCNLAVRATCSFFDRTADAGADSLLLADLPVEQVAPFREAADRAGLAFPLLAAPTTSRDRLDRIGETATGFVYLVSVAGVTGTRDSFPPASLDWIRSAARRLKKPVCVGFGISKPEHAATVIEAGGNGVVIGSVLARILEQHLDTPKKAAGKISSLLRRFRDVRDAAALPGSSQDSSSLPFSPG